MQEASSLKPKASLAELTRPTTVHLDWLAQKREAQEEKESEFRKAAAARLAREREEAARRRRNEVDFALREHQWPSEGDGRLKPARDVGRLIASRTFKAPPVAWRAGAD